MSCWRVAFGFLLFVLSLAPAFAGTLVQFRTTLGDIDVELFDADKPVTVRNFLRYVQSGLYTDMIMHRVATNWVAQGGGIYVANRGTINAGLSYIPNYPAITNEFKVGRFYSNVYGTIAMAKSSDPNSATSQFFFNLANNSTSLDNTNNSGGFTVFGRVVSGTNVLNRFNPGPTNTYINEVDLGFIPMTETPVLKPATAATATYSDLVYVDVSVLSVQVSNPGPRREISWKSVNGKTNLVEYTTTLPPAWKTLVTTNGNGNRITIADNSPTNTARFYRVRVLY